MVWPRTIEIAIATIENAPFLSEEQKRDIFYKNAARFLRLSEEEITSTTEGELMKRRGPRRTWMMRSGIALGSLLTIMAARAPALAQQPNYVARVQQLALEVLPGRIPSYYSSGARERAAGLQKTLEEAAAFFEEQIGVAPTFALAVLNEVDWAKLRPVPQETYAWFQGMFHTRLAEVYEKRGLEFLKDLRAAGIVAGAKYDAASELIARLEKVVPGFERWARLVAEENTGRD